MLLSHSKAAKRLYATAPQIGLILEIKVAIKKLYKLTLQNFPISDPQQYRLRT